MKIDNFQNQNIVEFIMEYLHYPVTSEEGELNSSKFLKSLFYKPKIDIVPNNSNNLKELNQDLFKDRDAATDVKSYNIYATLPLLSFESGTAENSILFEFMSKLRDNQLVLFESIINHKFKKIKWFHAILFLLYVLMTIITFLGLFNEEKSIAFGLISIILSLIMLLYEFIMYLKLGKKTTSSQRSTTTTRSSYSLT